MCVSICPFVVSLFIIVSFHIQNIDGSTDSKGLW